MLRSLSGGFRPDMGERPNIVLVMTDQQRFDTLGVNGNPLIRTPHLDNFARAGVRFSRSYCTTPICVTSRIGLHTGRYARAHGCYNNDRLLPEREVDFTLPALLRKAGYRTALIGKNHCFGRPPTARVFDQILHARHDGIVPPRDAVEKAGHDARRGTMQLSFAADPIPAAEGTTARLFQAAAEYIGVRENQPFFLWLSIPDPHPPYMVGAPYDTMYDHTALPPPAWKPGEMDNKPYRQQLVVEWNRFDRDYGNDGIDRLRRIYWGMVSAIDAGFHQFMERLRALGMEENTIVVFTSDHGDHMGDHRLVRKGPNVYDDIVHVPLIVTWKDHFPPRATDSFAANIDLLPTFCELAGIACPPQVQGVSLASVLAGASHAARDAVFFEHGDPGKPLQPADLTPELYEQYKNHAEHHIFAPIRRGRTRAVRTDRWKYVFNDGDVDELYDMVNDPHELDNVADRPGNAPIVREHRDRLLAWSIQTEDI